MSANTSQIGFIAAASTNISSSAYVEIPFGTEAANPATFPNLPISTSKLQITDTTGKLIKIAYILAGGAASSQIDMCTVAPNASIVISKYFAPGATLYAQALDSSNNATTGYVVVSLIP